MQVQLQLPDLYYNQSFEYSPVKENSFGSSDNIQFSNFDLENENPDLDSFNQYTQKPIFNSEYNSESIFPIKQNEITFINPESDEPNNNTSIQNTSFINQSIFQSQIPIQKLNGNITSQQNNRHQNQQNPTKKQDSIYKGTFQRICCRCQIKCDKFQLKKKAFQTHLVNLLLIGISEHRQIQISQKQRLFYSKYTTNSVYIQLVEAYLDNNKSEFIQLIKQQLAQCQNPLNVENIYTDSRVHKAGEKLYKLLSKQTMISL